MRTLHSHSSPILAAPETRGRTIRWAKRYDLLVSVMTLGRAGAIRRATADLAAIVAGDTVVDLGCGTGDLTMEAAKRAGPSGRVIGIDASPEMIAVASKKAARRRSSATFRLGVAEAIDLPDQSCDIVLSSLMLHHLPADVQRAMVDEVRRILRPGGRFVIVDMLASDADHGRRRHGHFGMLLHRRHAVASSDHIAQALAGHGFGDLDSGRLEAGGLGYVRGVRLGESDATSNA